jgi:hypothetical protein
MFERIAKFQAAHSDAVRGAIVMLAFPTHCGVDCLRGNKHTQDWNVEHMVRALDGYLLSRFKYPLVIFQEDYTMRQRVAVASQTRVPVVFPRVDFSTGALPGYLNLSLIEPAVRASHRGGNLSLPSMRGTYHGFGYRMMCRFYARHIFWHPVMMLFDWYMRVDAGDSRITDAWRFDPFNDLLYRGAYYGYHAIQHAARNHRFDTAIAKFLKANPGWHVDETTMRRFVDASGSFNGDYFYNNFEIVYMPLFRNPKHSEFFDLVDREYAFMLGNSDTGALGDADFRSVALALFANKSQLRHFTSLPYRHPVPWDAPYGKVVPAKASRYFIG